jgi:hypothetical protein
VSVKGAIKVGWSTQLRDEQAGEVLRWYEGLEAQLMDFIRVVPPHGTHNLNSWSSQLATILVEACCLIDSIFSKFRKDAVIVRGTSPSKDINGDAELYAPLLRLPERKAMVLTAAHPFHTPFGLWADLLHGTPYRSKQHKLEWWTLYARSKHDRIPAFEAFTLTKTIDALAGALIVISTVPAFTPMMVRRGWLFFLGHSTPREGLMQDYHQTLLGQREIFGENDWPFTVETGLFAVPIGHGHLPDDSNDFHPVVYEASPMMLRYRCKI